MQRSALGDLCASTLRRNTRISTRCSSSAARPNVDAGDVEFLRARKLSNKIIDHAAHGETKGPLGKWSFDYQSKPRQTERLARPARFGQKLSALRSQVPNWEDFDTEPMDMCRSTLVTAPGTLVEIRRFARIHNTIFQHFDNVC